MSTQEQIEQAAALIANSKYVVALTGAGISTPSGIPDFRSPGSGLWEKVNPLLVASSFSFRLQPQVFYEWARPLARKLLAAKPNPAHRALAELEEMGLLKAVITQNIDDLHQQAGSKRVLELHGNMHQATCLKCRKVVPIQDMMERFLEEGEMPYCSCGGLLKPNVVLVGDQLPKWVLLEAWGEAERCDLMLVVGSISGDSAGCGDTLCSQAPWGQGHRCKLPTHAIGQPGRRGHPRGRGRGAAADRW